MAPAPDLRDRVVRDLWWMATSPGLLAAGRCPVVDGLASILAVTDWGETPDAMARLVDAVARLDADPRALHAAVAPNRNAERFRLGAYFEDLVAYFVSSILGFEIRTGVVVVDNKRTVGEFDLLFRTPTGGQHWELAVKFFLHVPGLHPDPKTCFVGPQTRDRLHRKVARICDHQLHLPDHPAAERHLTEMRPLHGSALVRGRLFYPAAAGWQTHAAGEDAARDHLRGWWCPVDRCAEEMPAAHRFALLPRPLWLAPVDGALDDLDLWTRAQVQAWAEEAVRNWPAGAARSFQFAGLDATGRELHRGFLASVGWPGRGVEQASD